MKLSGQIVMFRFPQTDLMEGKLRPALLIGKVPGEHDDWLIFYHPTAPPSFLGSLPPVSTPVAGLR